jgi:hypothetical protein
LICIKRGLCFIAPIVLPGLIRIKDRIQPIGIVPRHQRRFAMPIDSILVSAAVISVFVVFAGVLLWGNFQTESTGQAQQKRRSF